MATMNIIFLICVVGVMILVPLNIWNAKKREQWERREAIKADMRQEIIDTQTRKKEAAKILREHGQKP